MTSTNELETEERTLPGRRIRVTMPDGEGYTVRITNKELVAWDKTAPRHKWGLAQEVPFLARSFLAWSASRRDGLTEYTFDAWNAEEIVVEDVEDEEGDDDATPTRRGPGADS